MEKEYLGLGVVFNALDKGFRTSVDGIKNALLGANKAMVETEKASGKGLFEHLGEGLKALSLSKIGSTLSDVKSGVDGAGHGVNELAKSLDFTRAKMTAALDPKIASKFQSQMAGLVVSAGMTGDQIDVVSHNLLNSGVSIDKMGASLPMIGTLVGKLGMDAGQVSTMFGQMQGYLKMSSKQATNLTKSIFKLQREYNLTNLMESLPEIVENVYTNMVKLGKTAPEMANRMVQDVGKMAAAFQKMGMSQQKATQTATGFNDKMNEVRGAFLDLQAGLDPNSNVIQDIYDAFGAGGLNATDLLTSIKSGKKSNEEIMKEMQGMVEKLPEQQRVNVMQRLRRSLGDDIANVIGPLAGQMKDVNAEAAKQSKKVGTADQVFASFNKQLNGTLDVQEKLMKAAKEFQAAMTTLMIKGNLMSAMAANTKATNEFTKEIMNADTWASKLARTLEGYKTMGLAYFFPDIAKVKPWLDLLTEIVFPLTALWGILALIKGPGKWFQALLFGVPKVAKTAGAATEAVAASTGLFSVAMEAAGAALGFLLSPVGLVIAGVVALGAAVAATIIYWDEIVDLVSSFDPSAGESWKEFGETVGEAWAGLKEVIGEAWDAAKNFFKDVWKAAQPVLKIIGKVFINYMSLLIETWKFFGGVVWMVFKGVVAAATFGISKFADLVEWGVGKAKELFTALSPIFAAVWDEASAVMRTFTGYFKSVITSVYTFFTDKWTQLSTFLTEFGKKAADTLAPVLDPIVGMFKKVKETAAEFLSNIWNDYLLKPFMAVKDTIMGWFGKIAEATPDFMKKDLGAVANAVKHPIDTVKNFLGLGDDAGQTITKTGDAQPSGTGADGTMNRMGEAAPVAEGSAPSVSVPTTSATPVKGQDGAPSMSNMAGADLSPTAVPTVDDKNTQAILQMLADTKDAIVKAVAKGNTVQVVLQGDARKFLTVIKQAAKNDAGSAGMNAALGG